MFFEIKNWLMTSFFAFSMSAASLVFMLSLAHAQARTEPLDDIASPQSVVTGHPIEDRSKLRAESLFDESPIVHVRFGSVDYKLAMAAHVGKVVRVYYTLPWSGSPKAASAVQVIWRSATAGFQSGALRPGQRVLVWSGVVQNAWMAPRFEVEAEIDVAITGQRVDFRPRFEIERD